MSFSRSSTAPGWHERPPPRTPGPEPAFYHTWALMCVAAASSLHCGLDWPCELRSEEHTSELQSRFDLVCRLLLEKKKIKPEKKMTNPSQMAKKLSDALTSKVIKRIEI